ncbi:uncharacterized protein LACBIDRAFT_315492 [Laccaria bicolor S238N-H82]|uniref:Predicted protein n=1 Tax=Laccaria bicolor (strain S238N-H82 / ATCC MYA-4686) TaxID=486041 RepID=B0D2I6_LACBS|nr:uncharacterized protein LACBIDRAFT_315492 [Laccaria bicolor S238N-H82]EDR11103.1 predicted protein [Laccaria bicolor S238N-H82]|eukprot:XP_001878404.1 predicted protein [Laccaria bicolor S238N-H82]
MPLSQYVVLPSFGVLISTSITLEFRRAPNRDDPVPNSDPLNDYLTVGTSMTYFLQALMLFRAALSVRPPKPLVAHLLSSCLFDFVQQDLAAAPSNGGASKKEVKLWRHLKKIFLKVKGIGGKFLTS